MSVGKTMLHGNTVSDNIPPQITPNSKVILRGTFREKKTAFGLNEDILSKHMLLVGGTGSGKSTLFYHIISQLKENMNKNDVMIIFDSKGDFHKRFFEGGKGDVVVGNSAAYRHHSQHWNIFKEIVADGWDDQAVLANAQEICRGLFAERIKKSGNNPFFPNAARDLLTAILVVMIRMGNGNPVFCRNWLYNSSLKRFLDGCDEDVLIHLLEDVDDMHSVLSYISGSDGAQAQGVLSEMFSITREIFMGIFAEKGSFSVRNFVREKGAKTLFLEYDLSIGSILTPVYRQFFDLALKEAMGRTASKGNVYLICDEFKLIPNLEHIDDGVNFGRSLGVKVFAGLQSIEQLYEIYGESRGRNIAAGFSTIIGFRANDLTTRNYITGLYGKNIQLEQYRLMTGTIKEEKREGNTVEDWDLNSLRVGEAIVGLPFAQPFRFYFDIY